MAFFTRLILALFGMALAVLFAVGVLFWLGLYVAFTTLRWLATGQKPQVLMMWQQIQTLRKEMQTAQTTRWHSGSQSADMTSHPAHGYVQRRHAHVDVVQDVVVREVREVREELPKP